MLTASRETLLRKGLGTLAETRQCLMLLRLWELGSFVTPVSAWVSPQAVYIIWPFYKYFSRLAFLPLPYFYHTQLFRFRVVSLNHLSFHTCDVVVFVR